MNKKLLILMLALLGLFLAACGGEEPAPPPASGETVEVVQPDPAAEPTATEEPLTVKVTSIHQIEGTWIAAADLGNFVATIDTDGTFRVATSLEDLERGSTDSWKLSFDARGQITATGFAMCLGDEGSYLATMNPDGSVKFTSIIDACEPRLRKMDRSLPGRLNPYNLIYYRVEFTE